VRRSPGSGFWSLEASDGETRFPPLSGIQTNRSQKIKSLYKGIISQSINVNEKKLINILIRAHNLLRYTGDNLPKEILTRIDIHHNIK
jgi:hypothetical protein